jgi:hypothetical protein
MEMREQGARERESTQVHVLEGLGQNAIYVFWFETRFSEHERAICTSPLKKICTFYCLGQMGQMGQKTGFFAPYWAKWPKLAKHIFKLEGSILSLFLFFLRAN